jgi:FHA domain-containing protein
MADRHCTSLRGSRGRPQALRTTTARAAVDQVSRDRGAWTLTDAGSKNGLWLDDARRSSFVLAPGVEVGIGSLRLIAESRRMFSVRTFLSRILGWGRGTPERIHPTVTIWLG